MTPRSLIALALVLAACKDTPPPAACGDLPRPACPEDNGADVCSDVICASVYACNDGHWTFVASCPGYDPDAAANQGVKTPEGGAGADVSIDAPPGAFGGPGCIDLESPDCALGTALACSGTPGCCDCEDLYVCEDGGWALWGQCGDAGIEPASP
ncbi:MAG: hypothetical protein ACRELB_05600 [Polyangiaceae bacterium]